MAEDIWKKIIGNIVPIMFAALLSVIGFLVLQVFLLNSNLNEHKLENLKMYMELDRKFEVQKVTVSNLKNIIDRMNYSKGGLSCEEASQVDFLADSGSSSFHSLGFFGNEE